MVITYFWTAMINNNEKTNATQRDFFVQFDWKWYSSCSDLNGKYIVKKLRISSRKFFFYVWQIGSERPERDEKRKQ